MRIIRRIIGTLSTLASSPFQQKSLDHIPQKSKIDDGFEEIDLGPKPQAYENHIMVVRSVAPQYHPLSSSFQNGTTPPSIESHTIAVTEPKAQSRRFFMRIIHAIFYFLSGFFRKIFHTKSVVHAVKKKFPHIPHSNPFLEALSYLEENKKAHKIVDRIKENKAICQAFRMVSNIDQIRNKTHQWEKHLSLVLARSHNFFNNPAQTALVKKWHSFFSQPISRHSTQTSYWLEVAHQAHTLRTFFEDQALAAYNQPYQMPCEYIIQQAHDIEAHAMNIFLASGLRQEMPHYALNQPGEMMKYVVSLLQNGEMQTFIHRLAHHYAK